MPTLLLTLSLWGAPAPTPVHLVPPLQLAPSRAVELTPPPSRPTADRTASGGVLRRLAPHYGELAAGALALAFDDLLLGIVDAGALLALFIALPESGGPANVPLALSGLAWLAVANPLAVLVVPLVAAATARGVSLLFGEGGSFSRALLFGSAAHLAVIVGSVALLALEAVGASAYPSLALGLQPTVGAAVLLDLVLVPYAASVGLHWEAVPAAAAEPASGPSRQEPSSPPLGPPPRALMVPLFRLSFG